MGVAGAGSGSPLLSVQLRQLGGALARAPADGGATSAWTRSLPSTRSALRWGRRARATGAHVAR